MKKLLSILLIVSTLFLSIGIQACFAKCIDTNSQSYEEYQKDLEIKELKRRLKDIEVRNEKFEQEKQQKEKDIKIQELEQLLKKVSSRNEKLINEIKDNNEPSIWSKIKNVFSSLFTVFAGTGLVIIPLGAVLTAAYYPGKALTLCIEDEKCHFTNPEEGHSYSSKFKEVKLKDALDFTIKAIPEMLKHIAVIFVQDSKTK